MDSPFTCSNLSHCSSDLNTCWLVCFYNFSRQISFLSDLYGVLVLLSFSFSVFSGFIGKHSPLTYLNKSILEWKRMRPRVSENTFIRPLRLMFRVYEQTTRDWRWLASQFWRHQVHSRSHSVPIPFTPRVNLFLLSALWKMLDACFLFQIFLRMGTQWTLSVGRYLAFGFTFLLWSDFCPFFIISMRFIL